MITDNSKYKKQHNEVISYVREQIGIDVNYPQLRSIDLEAGA